MSVQITNDSIHLGDLEFRDYSEQEKQSFLKVRAGYASQVMPILQALASDTSLLGKTNLDYQQLCNLAEEIVELQEAAQWLSTKLEQIEETTRSKLTQLKPEMDKAVEVARPLSKVNGEVANLFASLFDFIAEPRKKGESTKRKNQKSVDEQPAETETKETNEQGES